MENKRVFAGGLIAGAVLTLAVGGCAFVGVTLYQGTKNGSSLEEVGNKTTMEKVNVLEGMIDGNAAGKDAGHLLRNRRKGFVGYRNAASEDCKRNFRNAGGGSRADGKRPFV